MQVILLNEYMQYLGDMLMSNLGTKVYMELTY